MKSKTSCFNVTIFKKNITQYWPLWAFYLCFLLCMLPLQLWQYLNLRYYNEADQMERIYYAIYRAVSEGLRPLPTFLAAVIMAMAVFSYLYSPKNANMMHSFPVSRLELFATNYVSGLIFLLVPQIITFVAAMLVCFAKQVTCIQYLFLWLLGVMGMSVFAYSLAVFVAMFTGQLFAVPAYFFIANYLYVGCKYLVCAIIEMVSFGISDYWEPGKLVGLSPIYYLNEKIDVGCIYDAAGLVDGVSINGLGTVGIYAAAAAAITVAAYILYRRRQIETAGDMVSIGVVKPIFRWGVALCGGVLLSLCSTEFLYDNSAYITDTFGCIVITMLVFGFLCFFIAEMLLQKRFRVFKKKRILEWTGFAVASIAFLALFKLDVFGVEQYVPDEEEVLQAFVYMDYPVAVEEEQLPQLLDAHRQILASEESYLENAKTEANYYYTTIRYYLKDQTSVERRYPLPVTEEYLADADSPAAVFLDWEREPENLKQQILGSGYKDNEYFSGNIDLYSAEGEHKVYYMDRKEAGQIIAAVERDIEAGNFADFYTYCVGADLESYTNGISLEYRGTSEMYDTWDYYYNYFRYSKTGLPTDAVIAESTMSSGTYISFGPGCVNIIETLEELGIIDDTWKLMTYEEYEKAMEYDK